MSQTKTRYMANLPADILARSSPLISRGEIVRRLHDLRQQIEWEMSEDGLGGELSEAQAAILMDICRVLGLDGPQTLMVLGLAYYSLVGLNAPVGRKEA